MTYNSTATRTWTRLSDNDGLVFDVEYRRIDANISEMMDGLAKAADYTILAADKVGIIRATNSVTKETTKAFSAATPSVVSDVAHGLVNGDTIMVSGSTVPAEVPDGHYTVIRINDDTFSLNNTFNAAGGGGNLDWRKDIKITLPAAASHDDNTYTIQKVDANEGAVDVFDNDGTLHYYLLHTNQLIQLKSDGTNWVPIQLEPSLRRSGVSKNLIIDIGATVATCDITADEIVVVDTNGNAEVIKDVSLIVDMGNSGINGLDAAPAEAVDTWYYLWAIYNGSTKAGLISVSATAPTMPAGYTYKALIGVVRNDAGSDFLKGTQVGNDFFYDSEQVALTNGAAVGYTDIDCSSFVPPISREINILSAISKAGAFYPIVSIRPDGSTYADKLCVVTRQPQDGSEGFGNTKLFCSSAQVIEYKNGEAAAQTDVVVLGYKLNAI